MAYPPPVPFQLLEITVISAQDLAPISNDMHTYAIVWVHPDRKLSTRLDSHGHTDPSWNDKFVFRVDETFLQSDISAVMIEIYSVRWFRDVRVGTVRVLVGNLIPPSTRNNHHSGMRFVALQVRRPSGRPQGILNLGVALLHNSMRSMPLYTSSAVGYRDLMGEEPHDPHHHHHNLYNNNHRMPLRRSRSEHRSEATNGDFPHKPSPNINGSELGVPPIATVTAGSVWSESDLGTAPSMVAAEELFQVADVGGIGLEDWGADSSVEGLRSKLQRWRTELPPIYDRGGFGSYRSNGGHTRRNTDGGGGRGEGGGGLLSCFGDSYGCECSISCGLKPRKSKNRNAKVHLSLSDDVSRSYLMP